MFFNPIFNIIVLNIKLMYAWMQHLVAIHYYLLKSEQNF